METQPTKIGLTGELLHLNARGLWVNAEGSSGYHAWMTGAWVCYSCGHLCECGEE